jgi:peroxiredoxin
MDPKALEININQRRTLVETAKYSGFVKVGDKVDPFVLGDVGGGEVTLDDLLRHGPAVLIFFRFATCPACNLALPYYDRTLWPDVRRLGASLTAVSPQVPERLGEIKTKHGLGFRVASDSGNALGRRFGILYTFDEASQASSRASGSWIGETTGTGTWELPMPAVLVIDQDRIVRFADVSPDWLVRTEAAPVLEALRELSFARAE